MELGTAIALIIVALFLGAVIGVAVLFFVPFSKIKKLKTMLIKLFEMPKLKLNIFKRTQRSMQNQQSTI